MSSNINYPNWITETLVFSAKKKKKKKNIYNIYIGFWYWNSNKERQQQNLLMQPRKDWHAFLMKRLGYIAFSIVMHNISETINIWLKKQKRMSFSLSAEIALETEI